MAFLLAHLTDPHVPPLPIAQLRELAGKRMLGYLNWTRNRRTVHSRVVLDAIVADMQAQRPDHIAVTGDLVNLSLASEYAPARHWLDNVGDPEHVTVIPGNHDAYVPRALPRFNAVFAPYLADDDAAVPPGTYPFLRRRGPLAIVCVSSAVATPPLMATGWLGLAQRQALAAQLAALADEPVFRVVLIHHPLQSKDRHKRLTDSAEVTALLAKHGADLVLHGHDHVHWTRWIDGPRGRIPVVGLPSASAAMFGRRPPAAYNLLAVERDGERWSCVQTVRGFDNNGKLSELRSERLA